MKRLEAVALLTACIPLAAKLNEQGMEVEITNQDLTALAGFTRVFLDNWLDDPTIYRGIGLRAADIGALNFMSAHVPAEEMRRLRETGEPLDG